VPKARNRGAEGMGHRTGVPLPNRLRAGADPGVEIGDHIGPYMVSAEHEPITRVWGLCPQHGSGAEHLHGQGVRGQSPLKLNTF